MAKTDYGEAKTRTFNLSGISPSASGRRTLKVVWTIADVIATPHTVPSDRTRYTMDADTA